MNATLARLTRLALDPSREPDGRLLDAFLAGSQPAFRELVERHGRLVFAVCNRVLHHRQDAEDAFQAAFLVLARRAADVWPRDAVGSWLYGVAYRVALKARTARARRTARQRPLEDVARPAPAAPEPDTAEVVHRAVRRLPEVYRAAVIACDLEGLSRKAAAEQLGWSEGTLSGRLARARQLLAVRLRKAGLTLPAGGVAAGLGANPAVRAGLIEQTIGVAFSTAAGGVPAPVAALTEGVIPVMFAKKLQAAAAVVLVACSLGVGAWAAANGDGPGTGAGGGTSAPQLTDPKVKKQPPAVQPPPKISDDLQPFQGKWRVVSVVNGEKETDLTDNYGNFDVEITGDAWSMTHRDPSVDLQEQATITLAPSKFPKTIDFRMPNGGPVAWGIYEFTIPAKTCASCHDLQATGFKPPLPNAIGLCGPGLKQAYTQPGIELRIAVGTPGPRPAKFGSRAEGVSELRLARIAEKVPATTHDLVLRYRLAGEAVEASRAAQQQAQNELDLAKTRLDLATRKLQAEEERLKAALDALQAKGLPHADKDDPAFTVHVRPLAAAEKVIRVKATGKETVLEALAYAAEDMALKGEALSVWVVREKEILPVDLVAITQHRITTTNHVLKPGDQLFVQVKVGK